MNGYVIVLLVDHFSRLLSATFCIIIRLEQLFKCHKIASKQGVQRKLRLEYFCRFMSNKVRFFSDPLSFAKMVLFCYHGLCKGKRKINHQINWSNELWMEFDFQKNETAFENFPFWKRTTGLCLNTKFSCSVVQDKLAKQIRFQSRQTGSAGQICTIHTLPGQKFFSSF